MSSATLSFAAVTKTFASAEGEVHALRGANVSFEPGECVALTGRSGSGKSTFLRLAAGLDTPTTGEVVFQGKRVDSRQDRIALRRGLVSLVFQDYNLIPELTAEENIRLALHLAGRPSDSSTSEALDVLGVAHLARRLPHQMSGGEQQRVAIARTFAVRAPLLLADEPTGALDEENAIQVIEGILRICDEFGVTAVVATHDPVVSDRTPRVLRLDRGELIGSSSDNHAVV